VLIGEHVLDKHQPDAFAETGLADLLPVAVDVIVVGMQSDYCVRETSLSALRRGHAVRLVRGAHGTYDGDTAAQETAARVEAELRNAGVQIIDPQQLLTNVDARQPAG
jgi:nicotinamidase-related amidase